MKIFQLFSSYMRADMLTSDCYLSRRAAGIRNCI